MDVRTLAGHVTPSGFAKIPLGILDLGVFAGTFLLRFLLVGFGDDHFQHLSKARQILMGDLPIRDFFDAGIFLQNYLSSAAQLLFGYNLFGEAILTIAFVAFGAMLVFHLSAQLSGSRWLAAAATLLTVISFPRLYSYPKVFLYVSAIGLAWFYARRGSRVNLVLMAALTALAFLLRHDHGVCIAVMLVCFLGLREWGGALLWRRLGLYAGITAGLLLPFLVFVQTTKGLVSYFVGSLPQAQTIASSISPILIDPVPVSIDPAAPLVLVEPPIGPVNVRWAEGTDDVVRRDRERRYGLTAGVRQELEGRTWSYFLADHEFENVRSLVNDPVAEDTAGIDRETYLVLPERWDRWLTRRLSVLRLRGLLPGVFNAQNALAWFYYLTFFIPVVALGWVCTDWWAGRVARREAAVVAAAAILCLLIWQTLVRDNFGVRLPDVAAPTFVLAAWLASRRGDPAGSRFRRRLQRAGMAGLILVTVWSVWSVRGPGTAGSVASLLERTGVLGGPFGVWEQFGAVSRRLHRRPIDAWAPPGSTGLRAVTRYVLDCTAPTDRVLVTWFSPDVYYYAERGFAGGQSFFFGGWHASIADQRLTLERMQRQSVPIILGRRDQEPGFERDFPLVYEYVRTRYRLAAESTFGGEPPYYLVFVDTQMEPVAQHLDLGLPCYR